jgi:IclR family transcriptional regulator, KDG regulon repressor
MNNTLVKGLQLLEVLARSRETQGVSDLAEQLSLGKSNVHRLLQALVALGYVLKDESTAQYQVSLKLWELGAAVEVGLRIKAAAAEAMKRLLDRTRETVHLSVLDGEEVVYVHKLDSPEPVRAYSEIGGRAPAFCVATGKAMLAWQPEPVLAGVVSHLRAHTPRTITDPQEYLREMERIRANGYAVNRGEWRETVWGVGAVIRNDKGNVLAAIGVSGPSARIKPGHIKTLADEVMAAARLVEKSLQGAAARALAKAA